MTCGWQCDREEPVADSVTKNDMWLTVWQRMTCGWQCDREWPVTDSATENDMWLTVWQRRTCGRQCDREGRASQFHLYNFVPPQICTLDPGAIVGDITVLASVTKRTASVIANMDLVSTWRVSQFNSMINVVNPIQFNSIQSKSIQCSTTCANMDLVSTWRVSQLNSMFDSIRFNVKPHVPSRLFFWPTSLQRGTHMYTCMHACTRMQINIILHSHVHNSVKQAMRLCLSVTAGVVQDLQACLPSTGPSGPAWRELYYANLLC